MSRIAIIGTAGVPARYGGFETLAHRLVEELSQEHSLRVYCSNEFYAKGERPTHWKEARLHYLPLKANGIQSIPYDILSILHAVFHADVLLILGVSGAIVLPFVKLLFPKKKIIISIDGIEWKRGKWNPAIRRFLRLCERLAVRYSHADITDNAAIQAYTGSTYGTTSQLIEYGADHAAPQAITADGISTYPFLAKPYAFKVCRIEPENNLDMVMEAFAACPDRPLVVVGNWDKSLYGRALRSRYASYAHLHLLDPIYDQATLDMLRSNAQVYVHGHSAGGTNPSLVEAMYLGLPIFSFGVSYNRATTEDKALYFDSATGLLQLLQSTSPDTLKALALQMSEIAQRRYRWTLISQRYVNLIRLLLARPEKESIVPRLSRLPRPLLQTYRAPHLAHAIRFFESSRR